jgi:chromatin remodeling complex protein RSC6
MIIHKMPKAKKSDNHTVSKTVNDAPAVHVESSSAPSKKSVKSSKKAASVVPAETSTKAVSPSVGASTEETTAESTDLLLTETFSEFMAKLQTLASQMNLLKSEFRILEKKAVRELKIAQKLQAKRKRKGVNRQPSGFVKPTLISDELATFLKKPSGTEMARTEVTREINGYIRANSLQDKQNGRKINPDSQLAKLLKIGDGEELTYFNLQRYMSPHFAKAVSKTTSEATSS